MDVDDLILVSVDDHLIEPANLFNNTMPSRYRDRAPRLLPKDDGTYVWRFENEEIANLAINAVAGRPGEEWGTEPTSLEELRPGCYDIDERVKEMNANGLLGSMNFPSFPGFCGQLFSRVADKDLVLATLRAYNDWHIDEWAGAYPGRFMPLGVTALWDPQLAAAEVRRISEKGCHASPSRRIRASWATRAFTAMLGTRCGRHARTRARWCACTSVRRRSSW